MLPASPPFLEGSGDIVAAAQRLLSDENMQSFSATLNHLETITGAVAGQDENIADTISNVAEVTSKVAAVSDQLADVATNLDAILSGDAPEALRDARKALAEAEGLMTDLREVVAENKEPLAIFADEGLAQMGPAVAEARRMFKTLDQILREIDRDPRGYLLNESTPRYEAE